MMSLKLSFWYVGLQKWVRDGEERKRESQRDSRPMRGVRDDEGDVELA